MAASQDPRTIDLYLSALSSSLGWELSADIARNKEMIAGSDEAERVFRNTVFGETWVKTGDAPDWQRLTDRPEDWTPSIVAAGGLFPTAGADVQKDRIEVDVWAWGRGLEGRLVEHVVIEDDPGSRRAGRVPPTCSVGRGRTPMDRR
ncbi:terminase gpA endonuclease subunit [Acuticoccus sp.]|uniref:terminase gpA endonuclease subunit n=1 Tax=Acuticoccus sp. TaxID=1904378 RepID=UPI003B51DF04